MTLPGPYVTPRGLLSGGSAQDALAAGQARPLGQNLAFTAVELTAADLTPPVRSLRTVPACPPASGAWLDAFARTPSRYAGLPLASPLIMGVLNVTPDSFSDGGKFLAAEAAVAHGRRLRDAGADIIDVGGESTRPGAAPVPPDEEARRVVPVVRALAAEGACVSIDTRSALVMEAAVAAGARIVNDITGLAGDPRAPEAAARSGAAVMLMHMQGEPRTMQANPAYRWAPGDVFDFLAARIAACRTAGIAAARIAVDPGIGFGKTDTHNAEILDHLAMFRALGCAVAVGTSRKSFIGRMSRGEGAEERLAGSLASALAAAARGAQILRVHDVAETRQALAVAARIAAGG